MRFFLMTLLTLSSLHSSFANELESEAIENIIQMDGKHFCYLMGGKLPNVCDQDLEQTKTVMLRLTPTNTPTNRPWAIRLYFGNGNTFYRPTDMKVNTSRLDINMYDVNGKPRTGYQYFKFWEYPFKDAFKWIDEPTNNLKIVFDANNHQYFLSINHPKVIYSNANSYPNLNRDILVKGTIDGIPVSGYMPISQKFDGYNAQPGELNITKLENSWMFMQYELGYGYAIPLFKTERAGRIVFTPQIQAGIVVGPANGQMLQKGEYWEFESNMGTKYHVMGMSITPAARLEWQSKRQRIGLFAEYRYSHSNLKYPFMDGTIKHKMEYQSITFGFSTSIRVRK
jgi:hypothetical protein